MKSPLFTFPFSKQLYANDCGPTCIKMIVNHFGKDISSSLLREICKIDSEGVSVKNITDACQTIGLEALAIRINIDSPNNNSINISEIPLPAILYWEDKHFVVLYKRTKNFFFIADPGSKKMKLSKDVLKSNLLKKTQEGIAIVIEKSRDDFQHNEYLSPLNKSLFTTFLKKYLLPFKKMVLLLLLLLLTNTLLQISLPYITQNVFDKGIMQNNTQILIQLFWVQIFIVIATSFSNYYESIIANKLSQKVNYVLIHDFINKVLSIPSSMYSKKKHNDFIQRINDHIKIDSFFSHNVIGYLLALISIITYSILLAIYSVKILLLFFSAAILYIIWVFISNKKRKDYNYEQFVIGSNRIKILNEIIEGVADIKFHNSKAKHINLWKKNQDRYYENAIKNIKLSKKISVGTTIINRISYAVITFYTAHLVTKNVLSIGEMAAIQFIVNQFNSPMLSLVNSYTSIQDVKYSMERVSEIHNIKDEAPGNITNITKQKRLFNTTPFIEFRNVCFSYQLNGKMILKNINLIIKEQSTIAIVGSSGSGKTTILKLLLGLYTPTSGEILINGIPLNEIEKSYWRNYCGAALQDGFLFTNSILNNVSESDYEPNISKFIEATKSALLYDFIMDLPLKEKTLVGKSGLEISTGQRQRLLLARLFYKKPTILLFDEATNALDNITEHMILNNLKQNFPNSTKIIVAHKASSIVDCENIIVMKDGMIVEVGNHDTLINTANEYTRLFTSKN